MPAKPRKIPAYRLHKPTGQAVVRLDGKDHYLGRHGSPDNEEAYRRRIAEWIAGGLPRRPDGSASPSVDLSVNELVLAFWRHAEAYYRRGDGTATAELDNLRLAVRPLRRLYGAARARDFGPAALKAVRQAMVDAGLCRRTVNQRVARVVRLFRFGVESEAVPPSVHQALKAVPGLRAGRSGAKEGRKVGPVPEAHVYAVQPHLSAQLWAVVQLQRLTAMRSGEALSMRGADVDRDGEEWVYRVARHKGDVHGKERIVFLGPRAQAVLRPWLRADPAEFLFQPREAKEAHLSRRRESRVTPPTPSQRARTRKGAPRRAPGERYDPRTFNHAVARACARAGMPRWHPHQLRHNAATRLRKEYGLDVARAVLGHSSPAVTEVYAEVDREKARDVMGRVG